MHLACLYTGDLESGLDIYTVRLLLDGLTSYYCVKQLYTSMLSVFPGCNAPCH